MRSTIQPINPAKGRDELNAVAHERPIVLQLELVIMDERNAPLYP